MVDSTFSPSMLRRDDLSHCFDLVDAWIAILDRSNCALWSNRSWRQAMNLDDARAVGAAPHDYYEGPRRTEFEGILKRVRERDHPVRFEDAWMGRAVRTTIRPLAEQRLLLVTNLIVADGQVDDPPANGAEVIEIRHKSWGVLDKLTRREREVLSLLASGLTIKDAAAALERSQKTVEGHRDSIYRKLGAGSRAELATLAVRSGLIPPAAMVDETLS